MPVLHSHHDWRTTLLAASKLEVSGLLLLVVAGVLWLDDRIRSGAYARMFSNRWFIVGM